MKNFTCRSTIFAIFFRILLNLALQVRSAAAVTCFGCQTCNRQSYPFTGLDRPLVLQQFEAHRISRQSAHESKVVSPAHLPPLPSRENPSYSFLLETESTPGLYGGCKEPIGSQTRNHPVCSAVSQPTTPRYTPVKCILNVIKLSVLQEIRWGLRTRCVLSNTALALSWPPLLQHSSGKCFFGKQITCWQGSHCAERHRALWNVN